MAFTRIAGNARWSMLATLIQTDGSFQKILKLSRTAVWLPEKGEGFVEKYTDHVNSSESEWCSILDALNHEYPLVNLENDNMDVVNSLILQKAPKSEHLRWYYWEILEKAENVEWLGIRWIPRRLNRADDLFRKRQIR